MDASRDCAEGEIGGLARIVCRHVMRAVQSGLFLLLIQVTAAVAAAEGESSPAAAEKTYRITCRDGGPIELEVVPRGEVNPGIYVDVAGLRLYADTADSRRSAYGRLLGGTAGPFAARHFITDTLSKRRAETGVEPDVIPVQGEAGKKLGTEGMVLIRGGQYVRPGEYFISNYVEVPYAVKGERYTVQVSSFYIDKVKVTNGQYCEFLNDGNPGYRTPWDPRIVKDARGNFVPADAILADVHVVAVNWFQAAGYARWAGKRLPTEAEWEYAAGGSQGRQYPWGNEEPDKTRANYFAVRKHHTPGDAFPAGATPEGVFDLVGNSAEWVADYYDEGYYRKAPPGGVMKDPQGPAAGSQHHKYRRMFKGYCIGAKAPEALRVLKRHSRPPLLSASGGIGFRCTKPGEALLMGAAAQKSGMFLCVQDLPCPGYSFLHSASLSARIPTTAALDGPAAR